MQCTLCGGETTEFYKESGRYFFLCSTCTAVMLHPEQYIDLEQEKIQYLNHNNDVTDSRYQNFVSPITSAIIQNFNPSSIGLDYGCGTGPVAAVELQKKGFTVNLFDPFFEIHPEVLEQQYDFIICCEVMEHFHKPYQEFKKLNSMVNPGGKLYCKTSLFTENTKFGNWYYKNDPTHVFFYTVESLEWIRQHFGFKTLLIEPKMIVFGN